MTPLRKRSSWPALPARSRSSHAARKKRPASKVAQEKVLSHPKIKVRFNTEVTEFRGEGPGPASSCETAPWSSPRKCTSVAMFVFVGLQPNADFLAGTLMLTEAGFIPTTATLETNVPGGLCGDAPGPGAPSSW